MSKCPICATAAVITSPGDIDGQDINCSRCGKFNISGSAVARLNDLILDASDRQIANASGWIREHQNELITADTVQLLLELPTPSLAEKSMRLLKHLERSTSFLGAKLPYDKSFLAIAWVMNEEELEYVLNYLEANAYITKDNYGELRHNEFCVTPTGFSYLEQTRNSNIDSQIGFCAMWFDNSMKTIWHDAISPAILTAGYEPKRIDEHHHNNRIDDEIIALIRRSKFVVADFTGQRGGVYFEAGFALGMNLPVIWTVKKSELASVHFDNRQYNFVTWEENNLPEFKLNLQYRIEATLGRGTWKPE